MLIYHGLEVSQQALNSDSQKTLKVENHIQCVFWQSLNSKEIQAG
jgi:hypothetical protein